MVMAYIVVAYTVVAFTDMAYIVTACMVMTCRLLVLVVVLVDVLVVVLFGVWHPFEYTTSRGPSGTTRASEKSWHATSSRHVDRHVQTCV